MKPGYLTLPTIWRGCIYRPVEIRWSDKDDNPIDLTGWTPRAYSRFFEFQAKIVDATAGLTSVGLAHQATDQLKLGTTNWDFIWAKDDVPNTVSQPFLRGNVEIKEPVTDPHTHVEGRIGGGSNYIKMEPDPRIGYRYMNLIGLYHWTFPQPSTLTTPPEPPPESFLVRPVAQEQLAQMRENGQTKISILFYFSHAYLRALIEYRIAHQYTDGLTLIPFNPSGIEGDVNVRLTYQQEQNLYDFLEDVKTAGFTQLNVRFVPFDYCNDFNWPSLGREPPIKEHFWMQDRYEHNRNYMFSIIRMIQSHRGDLSVIYDLGTEHANDRLGKTAFHDYDQPAHNVHRRYCRTLWSDYMSEFDKYESMAFSCVTQFNQPLYKCAPVGLVNMLELFDRNHLFFPGYYGIDVYDTPDVKPPVLLPVRRVLVDFYDFLKDNYSKEQEYKKPIIIQETMYNDLSVFNQIKLALNDRPNLKLHSLFQWPRLRGHPDSEDYIFPDGFPFNYYNYTTL